MNNINNSVNIVKSCSLYYNGQKPPKKLKNDNFFEQINKFANLIINPDQTILINELDIQYSFDQKIKLFVKDHFVLPKQKINKYSTYTSYYFNEFTKQIITFLTAEVGDPLLNKRALTTLLLLERSNPELEHLCAIAVKFFKTGEIRYKVGLKQFQNRGILCRRFPVTPHSLSPISMIFERFYPISNSLSEINAFKRAELEIFDHQAILYGNTNKQDDFFNNLIQIAKMEGIASVKTVSEYISWLRDCFIISEEKTTLLIPSRIVESEHFNIRDIAREITNSNELMGAVSEKYIQELFKREKIEHRTAPFYFEGGDFIPVIDPFGRKSYLCGSGGILFSLLNGGVTFNSERIKTKLIKKLIIFDKAPQVNQVERVFNKLKQSDFLRTAFDENELITVSKLMIVGSECIVEMMEEYLGYKVYLLGDVFEAAPVFHLDTFLLAIPGKLLIQDHALSINILETILKNCDLTSEERERLEVYHRQARFYHQRDGEKYKLITTQLEKANFKVIPVPGLYYSNDEGFAVNYLNAIVGIGANGTYCITNGSSHSADRFLQEAFTKALQALGINRIYYAGKREVVPAGEADFYRTAEDALQNDGGIHCRTQTLHRVVNIFKPTEIAQPDSDVDEDEYEEEEVESFDFAMLELYNELIERYKKNQ